MAWNEPGSGGKDPWGGRNSGSNQGPPDLDEMIKKLQSRVSGMFGGRGGSGGGGGASPMGIGLIFVVAIVIWALSGIYIVDEGKRGVVLMFGAYHTTTLPGPHWHPRFIQSVEVVDIEQVRGVELGMRADERLMLTQDENIVDIRFVVQYRVNDAHNYLFNVRDPDGTLRQAMESAVREIVGKSTLDFVITGGRTQVAMQTHELMQQILDNYQAGLEVTSVNMQDAQPPEQVQEAFADAVRAREDEERLKNEAEAYANDIIPRARGQAARILEEADGYRARMIAEAEGQSSRFSQVLAEYQRAPDVTRERLYIETIESVFSSTNKVLVDVKGANNMMFLPLDRVMQQAAAGAGGQAVQHREPQSLGQPVDSRQQRDRARSREVR
ncbi:FtsH protease activity modulator HflK [Ectothiorhodospiraceae bacterium 2226]|nr:FtsH protease activity modulator HflK [Ectothiorhodospiraceae bacterium 2226]